MADDTTRSAEQEHLMQQWLEAWSTHDIDRLIGLFTSDLIYEDVTMGRVNRNGRELAAFAREFISAFPDATFEPRSGFATKTWGAAEWIMRGTHRGDLPGMPATGKPIEIRGASVLEFAGDKIRRCSDYWDMALFMRQLGFTPSA